ncbi:hemerythrin domain-containing protein [Aspergillus chevalieri]|uniref:Hemerythrin-like domain-containing protein n=1 Tax=Aspergillus chevalieri TaxID=182096 RepID=A0A7R7ZIW4_ASPCH|nr:uncharacterized protein ACHE_11437A [Aspergillus chevalieri]BCR84035.1 hypothetical protein ACHE_11437A [Aspergillus chevalieri]
MMTIRFLNKHFFPPVSAPLKRTVTHSPIMGTPRIINAIKQDHRDIESYYDRIIKSTDKTEQTQYQNLFTWELARHAIGEELVVYPAFEKHIKGGAALADKDRKEHQPIKEQLKKFQNLKPTDPTFLPTIQSLMKDLSQHIHEEETSDLPQLEEALSDEDSRSLSKTFGRTKMFVPSRSHPSAPSKPPFETAVGLMTAPIDHLADMFRQWPDTAAMPNPSTK